MNETIETYLSANSLKYHTVPISASSHDIKYIIIEPPRFGVLQIRSPINNNNINVHGGAFKSIPESAQNPIYTFSQADLLASRVLFRFKLIPFSPIVDYFVFNVSTSHLDLSLTSGPFRFDVYHYTRKKPNNAVIKPLIVTEGRGTPIVSKNLKITISPTVKYPIMFNVTTAPTFGTLKRAHGGASSKKELKIFTSLDLDKNNVLYEHDGSETPRDKVELMAWNEDAKFMFACQLDIIVKGVNNHAPRPDTGATFFLHVVSQGIRSLDTIVLNYLDEDWDSDRTLLKYSTKGGNLGTTIGNIYDRSVSLSRPIFQWTQADIDAGKLVFKHEGSEAHGSLQFWVTDGKFTVNGECIQFIVGLYCVGSFFYFFHGKNAV